MTSGFEIANRSPDTGALPYQLTVDGVAPLRVLSLTGREVISEAWSFDVVVTAAASDPIEQAALGQRAVLVFDFHEAPRAFYGVVAAVRLAQVSAVRHEIRYRLRVVPRLWLLKRKQRTRIFQRMRVPDVVTAVLLEAGIGARWQLTRDYPEREFTTQYEETDYRFVRRLLAEAGIYFYFPEGPPLDEASLVADQAIGAAAAAGGAILDATVGKGAGAVVGAAASMAETLIPGDTLIGADDAACYPPLRGDDASSLASSAAALAPAIGNAIAPGGGVAGAAIGAASAIAGGAIAALTAKAAPVLHFLSGEGTTLSKDDKVARFTLRNDLRSSAAAFRDYDPDRPMVRLQSAAVSTAPFPPSPFEIAAAAAAAAENAMNAAGGAIPGAAAELAVVDSAVSTASAAVEQVAGALGQRVPFEAYEHHSPFLFPKWAFASDEAPRILRQKRRRASIAEGEGGCHDLAPGHRFALEGHPAPQLDAEYVVTSVEHRGEVHPEEGKEWRVYWNAFECAPAAMTYAPPRPKRRSVQVALTATVVGPPNEEIHVDAKGQIRVQFHWDREGRYDERSSCWIRTMHPWGGAGWGVQFIPRVGMEVVVTFEGGDPDKPLVLGCVYNGTHPTPFALPADRTRSGVRTQSSPGGGGSNELSFEDRAGAEQVFVHAQRDLDEVVERNHTLQVRGDERLHVSKDRLDVVDHDIVTRVGHDVKEHVANNRSVHVEGDRIDVVTGNSDERVSGALITRVEGAERRDVRQNADLEYAADLTTRVRGCMTTLVGKPDAKRSWVTHAEGLARLSSLEATEVGSEGEIVLRVGKSSIRITSDRIELDSPAITVKGKGGGLSADDDGLRLASKGDAQLLADKKVVLKSKDGASLSMQKEVKVDGQQILLNSPDQANDPPPKDPDPPTSIELVDDDGKPLAHERFLITLDDGTQVSGMTDKDGKAELALKVGGKVIFPGASEAKAG